MRLAFCGLLIFGNVCFSGEYNTSGHSGVEASPVNQNRERRPDLPFLRVHDPSSVHRVGNRYWIFYTGRGVSFASSKDLVDWVSGPAVFQKAPDWVAEAVPGHRGRFWAPDLIRLGDRYGVYYSVSTFGNNRSAIALATFRSLDPQNSEAE